MNKIGTLFSKHFRNLHFSIIAVFIIVLIFGKTSITPYVNQVITVVFYAPFSIVKNSYLELKTVTEDNARLSQTLIDASVKIAMFEEAERENKRLRSVLGFEPPVDYTMEPAEIISIAGDYIPISAVINKGTNDSIWIDQPVINQQGLIGRISSVSADFAVVQLLTDPSNRVAARIADSREMGIIRYNTKDGMLLDNLPIQGKINVGDQVLSSGLGGVYPNGLNVGVITEIIKEELDPFYTITIQPAVNFYSLEEVFILREGAAE